MDFSGMLGSLGDIGEPEQLGSLANLDLELANHAIPPDQRHGTISIIRKKEQQDQGAARQPSAVRQHRRQRADR